MTITKILEGTLTAGQSSISFTDAEIPNSIIRVFPADSELIYESITVSSNTLTIVYPVQTSNKAIAVELTKAGMSIIDNTTSTETDAALSAKQGKLLQDDIDTIVGNLSALTDVVNNLDIPENITDLSDVNVTSIENGQLLAWDEDTNKFVNVDQSGSGSGINYSYTEHVIGTWVNGEVLYEKTIHLASVTTGTSYQHNINNVNKIWIQDIKATRNDSWFTSGHIFENSPSNIAESFSVIVNSTVLYTYVYGCTITDCDITLRYTKTV